MLFGDDFERRGRMTAVSLASQAVVALEKRACTGSSNVRRSSTASRASPSAPVRGDPRGRALAPRAVRRVPRARDGRPRLVQGRQRPLGHPAGDSVLREFATVLQETVRESTSPRGGAGRNSCSSCPAPTSSGGAQVAERIRVARRADRPLGLRGADPRHRELRRRRDAAGDHSRRAVRCRRRGPVRGEAGRQEPGRDGSPNP